MKKLSEYIKESLCEASAKGTPKEMFKNAIVNPMPIDKYSFDTNITDAIKNTSARKDVRSRNIRARKYASLITSSQVSELPKLGVGDDPMCICFGHLKSDKTHYGDYGRLYLLWDPSSAKDALESDKELRFVFMRGTCSNSTWEEWNFTLDHTEEWKAKTKAKWHKTYYQMAYDNRNWDPSEYKAFNDMVKDLTGTDPKISDKTPNVYQFTIKAW